MAVLELLLLVLIGLNISTMLSGYQLAMRMGYHLMTQVMFIMLAMMVSIGSFIVFLFLPDFVYYLLLVNLALILLATLLEFVTVLPILLKTMQGGPIHNSHITNLILTLFLLLGSVLYYGELILL
ncbi:MAG: hypothetical protein JSW61_02340 [Candidatus Thorarchaeota archaeon]|nr:MAG: hypothetical protein JSW61_02340 [Candidatus Thorarchaeota archaeon]